MSVLAYQKIWKYQFILYVPRIFFISILSILFILEIINNYNCNLLYKRKHFLVLNYLLLLITFLNYSSTCKIGKSTYVSIYSHIFIHLTLFFFGSYNKGVIALSWRKQKPNKKQEKESKFYLRIGLLNGVVDVEKYLIEIVKFELEWDDRGRRTESKEQKLSHRLGLHNKLHNMLSNVAF